MTPISACIKQGLATSSNQTGKKIFRRRCQSSVWICRNSKKTCREKKRRIERWVGEKWRVERERESQIQKKREEKRVVTWEKGIFSPLYYCNLFERIADGGERGVPTAGSK